MLIITPFFPLQSLHIMFISHHTHYKPSPSHKNIAAVQKSRKKKNIALRNLLVTEGCRSVRCGSICGTVDEALSGTTDDGRRTTERTGLGVRTRTSGDGSGSETRTWTGVGLGWRRGQRQGRRQDRVQEQDGDEGRCAKTGTQRISITAWRGRKSSCRVQKNSPPTLGHLGSTPVPGCDSVSSQTQ